MLFTKVFAVLAYGTTIAQSTNIQNSYFHLPVIKKRYNGLINNNGIHQEPHFLLQNRNKILKRDGSGGYLQLDENFVQIQYQVELEIGSNKDYFTLMIDTGSSDLIVSSYDNELCLEDEEDENYGGEEDDEALYKRDENNVDNQVCPLVPVAPTTISNIELPSNTSYPVRKNEIGAQDISDSYYTFLASNLYQFENCVFNGMYNYTNSATFQNLSIPLDITYSDGESFVGFYATDDVYIYNSSLQIENMTIGVGTTGYRFNGVLGLGFKSNENSYQQGYEKYDNFPYKLKNQGIINKAVYSFYGSYKSSTPISTSGSVLFGAYDSNGYKQSSGLTLLPIIDYSPNEKVGDGPYYISITLNSLSFFSNKELIAVGNAPVILDTGSSTSTIPTYILNEILVKFGFEYSTQLETYVISESDILDNDDAILTFEFQGATIRIPVIAFTLPIIDGDTNSKTGLRAISVSETDNDYFLLGDDFLTHVYFVVDLEDEQIALGQLNDEDTEASIKVITDEIEDAVKASRWDEIYGYDGSTTLKLVTIDDPNDLGTINELNITDPNIYVLVGGKDIDW